MNTLCGALKQINPKFVELMKRTEETGKEYAIEWEQGTFHTHPNGVPYPSGKDVMTGVKIGKPLLCIGLVPQKTTMCWSVKDNMDEACAINAKGKMV